MSRIVWLILMLSFMTTGHVFARDDGRYAGSPLRSWFEGLSSQKGLCCSVADGQTITDSDWDAKDGHYRVRLPDGNDNQMTWIDVPDDAVINEPNLSGRTMVWPTYLDGHIQIRCFMPGPFSALETSSRFV